MKVPFNINLSGKTAIVTGGSGTLCSAMAYGLAVCGAKVAIIGRNKEKLASVSLLDSFRNQYQNWLEIILRQIYNSGGFLVPICW